MKTIRYKFQVGLFMRSTFEELVRDGCFNLHLKLQMDSTKRLLSSTYRIVIKGSDDGVDEMKKFLDGLIVKFQKEDL